MRRRHLRPTLHIFHKEPLRKHNGRRTNDPTARGRARLIDLVQRAPLQLLPHHREQPRPQRVPELLPRANNAPVSLVGCVEAARWR
jgi:hypothetical protein